MKYDLNIHEIHYYARQIRNDDVIHIVIRQFIFLVSKIVIDGLGCLHIT